MLVDMNTTPLIDVMLVLLIMLIITIPVQLHSVNLNLPTPSPQPQQKPPEAVQLQVATDGALLWNGEALGGVVALQDRMRAIAALPEVPELHIRPDKSSAYKYTAAVLAAAQREGLRKLGIVNGVE